MFVKSPDASGAVKAPKSGTATPSMNKENVSKLTSKACVSGRATVAVTLSFLHGQSDGRGCFDGLAGQFVSAEEQHDLVAVALLWEPDEVIEAIGFDAKAQQQAVCPKRETRVKQNVSVIRYTTNHTILPTRAYSIIADW
jgi:hypothetical protein